MKSFVTILSLLAFFSTTIARSEILDDCKRIPKIEKEIDLRYQAAHFAFEEYETLSNISEEARRLRNVSIGIGITSGLLMLGANGLLVLQSSIYWELASFGAIEMNLRFAWTALGGLASFLIGGLHSRAILYSTMAVFSHPDLVYLVGNGVYQIVREREIITINLAEIKSSEWALKHAMGNFSEAIELELQYAPGGFSNALSQGGNNAIFYTKIADLAEIRARLAYDLVNISVGKLRILKEFCSKH